MPSVPTTPTPQKRARDEDPPVAAQPGNAASAVIPTPQQHDGASPADEEAFLATLLGAAFAANIVFVPEDRDLLDCLVEHGLNNDDCVQFARTVNMTNRQLKRFMVFITFVGTLREAFVGKAAQEELHYVIPLEMDEDVEAPRQEEDSTPEVDKEGTQAAMLRQSGLLPQNTLATAQQRWNGIARRLLYMCAFWAEGTPAPLESAALFKRMETNLFHSRYHQLSQNLVLIEGGCDTKRVLMRLEDYAMVHTLPNGTTFFPK